MLEGSEREHSRAAEWMSGWEDLKIGGWEDGRMSAECGMRRVRNGEDDQAARDGAVALPACGGRRKRIEKSRILEFK